MNDLEENEQRFKEWAQSAQPEAEKLPLEWKELDRTYFLKLLVLCSLRPDRLPTALIQLVQQILPIIFLCPIFIVLRFLCILISLQARAAQQLPRKKRQSRLDKK